MPAKLYNLVPIWLCLVVFAATAAEPWWDNAWQYRMPLTVIVGLDPGKNPLVVVRLERPDADLSSFRVLDGSGREIPCAAREEDGGCRFVAWRLGEVQILEKLPFMLYFSRDPKPVLAPADIPQVLPGMNLLPNSDFSRRDQAGDLADWNPTSGYGVKVPWNPENRAQARVVEKDGGKVLALSDISLVGYVTSLQEGHQYELSYQAWAEAGGGSFGVTVWMQEKDRPIPHYARRYGNYKIQSSVPATGSWSKCSASTFVYFDRASEKMMLNNKKLLPNTGGAYINMYCKGQAFLRDFRLQDVTEAAGLMVRPGEIEECPR